jgi:hypothetical protein
MTSKKRSRPGTHEDVRAAFLFLQEGCTCLVDDAAYWFNRGCYHCHA